MHRDFELRVHKPLGIGRGEGGCGERNRRSVGLLPEACGRTSDSLASGRQRLSDDDDEYRAREDLQL